MKSIVVNLKNLNHNIDVLKSHIKHNVLFCAVVKANAYGHGFEICKLIENKVDYFAVATAEEAIRLRKLKIRKRILVLGVTTKDEKRKLVSKGVDITISSLKELYQVVKFPARIHIKINTGMNRLGFSDKTEIYKCLGLIRSKKINLIGAFSHFYNPTSYKDCKLQDKKFKELIKFFPKKTIFHISSTDAIFCSKEFNYSMVRCGIGMYGYSSYKNKNKVLLPVMKVYGDVVQTNTLKKDDGVGYSHYFISSRKEKCYVINCGYFDGFSRALANQKIRASNEILHVCGNVCMDMMFIKSKEDLEDKRQVCLLENASELAKICNTIPYEILTNIKHERFNYIVKKDLEN